jgi:multidrug efflux pump
MKFATDQLPNGLVETLNIDRASAARMGISTQLIDETLYDAFGQRQISTLYTQLGQYHVILETLPEFQLNPSKLQNIYVRSALAPSPQASQSPLPGNPSGMPLTTTYSGPSLVGSTNPLPSLAYNGSAVPLSAIAHLESGTTPLTVNHQGQFPVVTLSFNLAPHASLGEATDAIENLRGQMGMPASIQAAFQGAAAAFRASLQNEPLLILAALITVYIVLGVLYESFIHPVTILSTLPSAGVGACLALILSGNDLNVVSIIGIILLIGIVKKNGIMMIDFALEAERKERSGHGDP